MIGGITPPALPAGYLPLEVITGDIDRLKVSWSGNRYEFPSGTKIKAHREKEIVMTSIPGGKNGTIKELTGYKDWTITVEFTILASTYGAGSFAAPTNPLVKTMRQKMRELRDLWEQEETLWLSHAMLRVLGITNVVCQKFELLNAPIQYKQGVIITFLSDEEYDLDLASIEAKNSVVESSL
ncbi:DUF6046 domain-containing protein [Leptospira noguchii]|uniref:DUF6046 domain-containing protein n=1 Tax=Leptospira noguchii TaxID=28182 RepID=M6VIQ2_9LEPT|nr:DUF6046 domain-containing protein [Leptospira noguchii]EMO53004.1 hypothetical protein LEP1GSC172_2941 [Leptospira noguchii]